MLRQPLERLPREIQTVERQVLAFERRDEADRLRVVIEAAEGPHRDVERPFAGMSERRMAEVVGKRNRLGQIFIEAELPGDRARDLRHLERVGQPRAVVIALVRQKDLRLVGQTPKGGRMQHAVAVALEGAARRALRFVVKAAPRRNRTRGIARQAPARRAADFARNPRLPPTDS